jgi:hypothetical protein
MLVLFHCFLGVSDRARIAHVSQNLLDHWVLHDYTNFWVCHGMRHSFFVTHVLATDVHLNQFSCSSTTLNAVLVAWLNFKSLLKGI